MQLTELLVVFVDVLNQVSLRNTVSAVFIWHFVNPIETEMGLFTFGCSLFARFSVSTVGLGRA